MAADKEVTVHRILVLTTSPVTTSPGNVTADVKDRIMKENCCRYMLDCVLTERRIVNEAAMKEICGQMTERLSGAVFFSFCY